jgi:glucose/arabinose dehydrogenase
LAFHPDGRLFATEHGMDERSRRYIVDDPDDFYEIQQGTWYGWPDYASGIRLDDPYWGDKGQNREPVIAIPPNPNPPKPLVMFGTHEAANGVDFSRSAEFGFEGDAFVACFGDLSPITTVSRAIYPAGFKVVRVDMNNGQVHDFAVNRIAGPASKLPHEGFERPSHCAFSPDGALYVTDFGVIKIAPEIGGIRIQKGSGVVWRIRRISEPHGLLPPKPKVYPIYLLQYLVILVGILGAALGLRWLIKHRVK